jgi:hypothetical protein
MSNNTQTQTPAHTPTPWHVSHDLGDGFSIARDLVPDSASGRLLPVALAVFTPGNGNETANRAVAKGNADFIVEACNSHAALVARVAELEQTLTRIDAIPSRGISPSAALVGLASAKSQARAALAKEGAK